MQIIGNSIKPCAIEKPLVEMSGEFLERRLGRRIERIGFDQKTADILKRIVLGTRHMTNLVGSARVSTDDQDLASQITRLDEAGTVKNFTDKITGKRFDRPGLDALLEYVRTGDTVVVVRLDRMGRDLKELLEIVALLKEKGVGFSSLTEKLDTTGAAGELIFHVFGAIAQFERSLNAERTRDGLVAAKARGSRRSTDFHFLGLLYRRGLRLVDGFIRVQRHWQLDSRLRSK